MGIADVTMQQLDLKSFLDSMPKVELHVHLEGAIPYEAMYSLVEKYGGKHEVKDIEGLKNRFTYTDFPHFIETWIWKNGFIREYEDFTFIANEVAKDLITQNIKYAEIFYSPPDFKRAKLSSQRITESIAEGLKPHSDEIEINLVADLVRDFGAENAMKTLHELNEVKHLNIVGIGIGGSEQKFPPEIFKDVFSKARDLGFKTSAHAGEASGSESIWGAVRSLKVDRIGHGTRAYEDRDLVSYLASEQIPVELCPISNVRTGVVKCIEEHPAGEYYRAGMKVFLNTDDPKMFNNSLSEEYFLFVDKLGFNLEDVKTLMHNAIDSAWCSTDRKKTLNQELTGYFGTNPVNSYEMKTKN